MSGYKEPTEEENLCRIAQKEESFQQTIPKAFLESIHYLSLFERH
jgi:hypothetical protein